MARGLQVCASWGRVPGRHRGAEDNLQRFVEVGVGLLREGRAVVSRCSFIVARVSLLKKVFKLLISLYMLKIMCC